MQQQSQPQQAMQMQMPYPPQVQVVPGGVMVPVHSTESIVSEELRRRARGLKILCVIELFFWCWATLGLSSMMIAASIPLIIVGIYGAHTYNARVLLVYMVIKVLMFCVLFGLSVSLIMLLLQCLGCNYAHPEQLIFFSALIIGVLIFQLWSAIIAKRVRLLILENGGAQSVDNFELSSVPTHSHVQQTGIPQQYYYPQQYLPQQQQQQQQQQFQQPQQFQQQQQQQQQLVYPSQGGFMMYPPPTNDIVHVPIDVQFPNPNATLIDVNLSSGTGNSQISYTPTYPQPNEVDADEAKDTDTLLDTKF